MNTSYVFVSLGDYSFRSCLDIKVSLTPDNVIVREID